jgi:hypothetical protein
MDTGVGAWNIQLENAVPDCCGARDTLHDQSAGMMVMTS